MGGIAAFNIVEETFEPSRLNDGNFWAVSIDYSGALRAARFERLEESPFPNGDVTPVGTRWKSLTSKSEYCAYVESIRSAIESGELYQANAARVLQTRDEIDLANLFAQLLEENPAPYSSYFKVPGLEIASASPELFLERIGGQIKTSPIKGTQESELDRFGEKDQSENIMIVDLMRNDLGRICRTGSIQTPELLREEKHPGLNHLVSDVTGTLSQGIGWDEIFEATLPAGSISGAPKSAAIKIISAHEGAQRGPYCGVLGWVHGDHALLSVAIRIFWKENGITSFGTGAGITWSSDPQGEWEETQLKAKKLLSIAGGAL